MARTKGMLNLSGNLEVNAGAPLDARTVVPTVADLTIASNFQYKYVGMPVVVQATGDMYTLLSNDVTDIANWKPVGKTYTAGTNVNISDQNVISATDTTYTAGTGIDITNGVISATGGGGSSYTAGDGIVIEDDEISTDNMPAADMSEIVTPLPSVMSRLPRYSTEEQIVGYWIDGKPLYQITKEATGSFSGDVDNFLTLPSNAVVKNFICSFDRNDGLTLPIPYAYPNASANQDSGVFYFQSSNQINFRFGSAHTVIAIRITVQYTKTTDTPV